MLEFVVVFFLAQRNGRVAEARGHAKRQQWLITIGFWFGAEIAGALVGVALFGDQAGVLGPVYVLALGCAVLGGVGSWLYTNSLPIQPWAGLPIGWLPTHLVPAGGLPVFDYPNPSRQPVGTAPESTRVMITAAAGDWAQIRTIEGWMGWVDGRRLVPANPMDPSAFTPPGA